MREWPSRPATSCSTTGKPDVRPDVSAAHAADLVFGLLGPELYLVLVRDRDWSPDAWEEWVRDTLTGQLCTTSAAAGPSSHESR